jgi:hypothetical protein
MRDMLCDRSTSGARNTALQRNASKRLNVRKAISRRTGLVSGQISMNRKRNQDEFCKVVSREAADQAVRDVL